MECGAAIHIYFQQVSSKITVHDTVNIDAINFFWNGLSIDPS